jgi:hypothetical protein
MENSSRVWLVDYFPDGIDSCHQSFILSNEEFLIFVFANAEAIQTRQNAFSEKMADFCPCWWFMLFAMEG